MNANYAPIVKLMADLLAKVNAGTITINEATREMPDGLGIVLQDNGQAVITATAKGVRSQRAIGPSGEWLI